MATAILMRSMFDDLGFNPRAQRALTDDQQVNDLSEIAILSDDEVESLCKLVRRPGGQVPNPRAAVAGQPAEIAHPGTLVSMRAVTNLKLACFFVRHRMRTSRTTTPAQVTLDDVRELRDLREKELSHTNPTTVPQVVGTNWPKILEEILQWIGGHRGVKKAPLDYVVREHSDVPAEATDHANGAPGSEYVTDEEEMTARSPHTKTVGAQKHWHPDFATDNARVWALIAGLTQEKPAWTIVKPFQAKKDGRGAFQGLWNHYLGPNNIDNLATEAESALEKSSYMGETKRWNFDQYVRLHMDQHQILSSLTSHGYAGIDERSKVRHLMAGIKTDKLDTIVAQILSNADLRVNFTHCVTLYKDYISQARHTGGATGLNISAVQGDDKGTKRSNDEVEECDDRYYTSEEYTKLTQAQRYGLLLARKARGSEHAGKRKKSKRMKAARMEKSISVLASAVDKIQMAGSEKGTGTSDAKSIVLAAVAESEKKVTNATHSALTRIATRQMSTKDGE